MNIAIFETEDWERAACEVLSPAHQLTCLEGPIDAGNPGSAAEAEIISSFVNSRLPADVLRAFPKLRLIATRSTGFDHIDLGYCADHGITVSNVPDYGDATVAEHTFALLLAAVRHVVTAVEHTRRGDFSQAGLRGMELRGKIIGVIGTGRIGRRVIEIARGFGMNVLAHDLRPDAAAAERLGYSYVALPALIRAADVITLHVPANAGTAKLLSDREFEGMRDGAVLINTSRGTVVDTAALVRSLSAGKLRAVGLDVLPQESVIREEAEIFRRTYESTADLKELLASHVLMQFDNVLVTPHTAYDTDEAVHRIVATTIENIRAFAAGTPQNVVYPPPTLTAAA